MKPMTAGAAGIQGTTPTRGPLGNAPQTHGATVVGWLLVCFSIAPLAMAVSDRRSLAAWVGGGMLVAGIVAVLTGRSLHER